MKSGQCYYVYMMTNFTNTVIYTGVTNDIVRRVCEHKDKPIESFTSEYNVTKLVYCESYNDPESAISREKQIKAGSRKKKIDLITKDNPEFLDLYQAIL